MFSGAVLQTLRPGCKSHRQQRAILVGYNTLLARDLNFCDLLSYSGNSELDSRAF